MAAEPKLVVIVGPTASGKSDLAMRVAEGLNGEIICADSRTVYKGMDIATAKPSKADRKKIKHHLLDVVEPGQIFTASDFKQQANEAIAQIASRSKLPILVGGSGLYVDSVIFDYNFAPKVDERVRKSLEDMSLNQLNEIVKEKGIELGGVNPKNKRHLIRAIERGGIVEQNRELRKNTILVGILPDKEVLAQRIQKRAETMIADGFIDEGKKAIKKFGWNSELSKVYEPLKDPDMTEENVLEWLVRSHKSLAKRQLTWFKRNPSVHWFSDNNAAYEYTIKSLNK